jgi:hypothetical protein
VTRSTLSATDPFAVFGQLEEDLARASTAAMKAGEAGLKADVRDAVQAAGLGRRLALTWRGEVYPKARDSLDPAAFVWTRDPLLMDVFSRGATVTPRAGGRAVVIPTENVPAGLRRRFRRRRTDRRGLVAAIEQQFGPLSLVRQGNKVLGFVQAVRSRGRRGGVRPATPGRRSAPPERVLMLVFVRQVRLAKRLDLDEAAAAWAARVPRLIEAELLGPSTARGSAGTVKLTRGA